MVNGFVDYPGGAKLRGLLIRILEARHNHNGNGRKQVIVQTSLCGTELPPVHPRHSEIQEYNGWTITHEGRETFAAIASFYHVIPFLPYPRRQHSPRVVIIFNDQHRREFAPHGLRPALGNEKPGVPIREVDDIANMQS